MNEVGINLKTRRRPGVISIVMHRAEERYRVEPVDQMDAAKLFLRRWALTLVDQALRRLEAEMLLAGKERLFARLEGFLVGEKSGGTYADAAVDLGLSEAAVKMAVSRLRQRCRELLREEIAQTVPTPAEVDEEYRMLIAALAVKPLLCAGGGWKLQIPTPSSGSKSQPQTKK
jgi:RNA polymerase sigma-70 factor (ECF subfamily)